MEQRQGFNTIMKSGFDFDHYKAIESNHQERMQTHWEAIDNVIEKLTQEQISRLNIPLRILVIAEAWCGDCGNGVPIISRLVSKFSSWEYKIALRDEHEELVNHYYLTAGKKKIPAMIVANQDGDEINRWIERPARSYKIVQEIKNLGLPKEEMIDKFRSTWELKAPSLSEEIFREILEVLEKATAVQTLILKTA